MWTDKQKRIAVPRILTSCRALLEAFEKEDMELFWFLSGMLAGGLEKLEEEPLNELSAAIMKAGREYKPDDVCYLAEQASAKVRELFT